MDRAQIHRGNNSAGLRVPARPCPSVRRAAGWPQASKIGRAVLGLAFLVVAAPPVSAQGAAVRPRKAVTVERIYGSPSLSGALTDGLEWSPDGKLLSYFQRAGQGPDAPPSLWVLEVASGKRRILLDSDKLRPVLPPPPSHSTGQQTGLGRLTPQRYFWAPGSDALLFVSQGQLHWFDLKTNSSKPLGSG
jgi:dipeptidyl-peptidase-4